LKRENNNLKQQLQYQKNDALSDSFHQMPNYKTLDCDSEGNKSEQALQSISSTGNTNKFSKHNSQEAGPTRRDDSRSLAAKTDESSMKGGSTFQRGTGMSMFPSLNRGGGTKATSKILNRIM
jgi:hypothetical protein